jgi:O-antigen/teichoic acid export membrane protein
VKSNTTRLLVRNFSHLVLGQVASSALGILLSALLGRALEPAQFGVLYTAFAILAFVFVVADWGQGPYLVREMARGRIDEPELIGSALLIRLAAIVFSSVIAVVIALALGYSDQIVTLTLLAVLAWVPFTLYVPLSCSFRSRDRMDIDAFAGVVGKATTLVATAVALRFGGGLMDVMLMQGVGNISILLVGTVAARRLNIAVKAPVMKAIPELLRHGAPIAAFSLVIAWQPFVEIMLLSAFAGPAVVGWYAASRTLFGVVISPAAILVSSAFPQLSRTSDSLPDLRRTMDATGRAMFIAAAFTSSALYLFADHMVAIIYGHGRFEETASILRVSAIFIPLLYFGYLLAGTMLTVGRNKAMAIISIVKIALCVILSWLLIGYWQQRFGNGAIALVIIVGVAEIPALIGCLTSLPRGVVGSTTTLNLVRACIASLCTVAPLAMLQPIGLLYLTPLFLLLFGVIAMVTRLVLLSDLQLAMDVARSKVLTHPATKSVPDG